MLMLRLNVLAKMLQPFLSKVFVVMDKVWQLPLSVDHITGFADGTGQGARTTTEHSNLAHLEKDREFN